MKSLDSNLSYFQFFPENNYPIIITCDLKKFDPNLKKLLNECGAILIPDPQKKLSEAGLQDHGEKRILHIKEGTSKILYQIGNYMEGDKYGLESITPSRTYNVYRYKGSGLMVFSFKSSEWELGVHSHFGNPQFKMENLTIFNRFLALSLAPLKIVGFWGFPQDKGVVITDQIETLGEAIFIDLKNNALLYKETKIKPEFPLVFFRHDPQCENFFPKMTREELFSFLLSKNIFFNYGGKGLPIKESILQLTQVSDGRRKSLEGEKKGQNLQV